MHLLRIIKPLELAGSYSKKPSVLKNSLNPTHETANAEGDIPSPRGSDIEDELDEDVMMADQGL